MTAEPLPAICSEVRLSEAGRVWTCVLDADHEPGKHYMIVSEAV